MIFSNSNSSNASIPWLLCAVILVTIQNTVLLPQGADTYSGDKKIQNTTTSDSDGHASFLARSSEESDENSHHNDSLMCFPYFISQDVDSLLNQALKMLSKSKNDRQKSWLQLFVHRLESLSTQLRQLPTEHKNRCFHIRERLATDRLEDHLASAPEEIQLRFARKLFLGARPRVNAIPRNNRLKQYVTGTISTGQNQAPPEYKNLPEARSNTQQSNQSNIAQNTHQSNKHIEEKFQNSKLLAKLDVDSAFKNSHISPVSQNQYRNEHPRGDATSFPSMTRWESQNMDYETMPFLPRATRKIIPRPIEDRMRFRALSSLRNHRTTTTTIDQAKAEIPTVLPIIEDEHSKDSAEDVKEQLITTNSPLENQHHREPSTQQYEESAAQLHDQEFNSPPLTNHDHKALASGLSTLQTIRGTEDDDDLVLQLHSGGKYTSVPKQHMHPRLLLTSKQVNNWPQATPSETASHSPGTEKISSNEDLLKTETPVLNTNTAQNDDGSEINMVRNNNDLTNLDFDYEEQGAATGELFIDDEVVPTKLLAVPSSVGSVENVDSNEEDDIVKQLDELKSFKTSNSPSDHPTTDSRLTMSTGGSPVKSIPHLLHDK